MEHDFLYIQLHHTDFVFCDPFAWMEAEKAGFYTLDEFILLAKNRLHSGKIKKQEHARKFHSHFFVFKKSVKEKPINYYKFKTNENNK